MECVQEIIVLSEITKHGVVILPMLDIDHIPA